MHNLAQYLRQGGPIGEAECAQVNDAGWLEALDQLGTEIAADQVEAGQQQMEQCVELGRVEQQFGGRRETLELLEM